MATTLTLRRVGCRLFCLRLRYRRRLRQNKRLYGYAGVVVHRSSAAAPSTSMYSFSESLLHNGLARYRLRNGAEALQAEQAAEVTRLKRRLAQREEAVAILKTAAAYFARESR